MFYPANAGGDTHQYREERRTWRAPKETGWDPKWARGSVETLILPESRCYDSPRKMGRLGNNKSPKFEAEKSLGALSFLSFLSFIVFIVGLLQRRVEAALGLIQENLKFQRKVLASLGL